MRSAILVLALLAAAPCLPQRGPGSESVAVQGGAFEEGPYQRAVRIPGTGEVSFPVTTEDRRAQKFFDQGVGLLHGYWLFEAERSFHEAATRDPDCAMAWWGMAMANVNSPHRAVEFAWEAFRRRHRAGRRERMYIEAYARYLGAERKPEVAIVDPARGTRQAVVAEPTPASRGRLLDDLAAIVRAFPDDLEARAFLLRERAAEGEPSTEVRIENERMLGAILAAAPLHPAHHYRIRLSPVRQSLDSAWKCGLAAPAIGNMWHAGGGALALSGRHGDAAWMLEAAARVHHAHMQRSGAMPYEVHDYTRTLGWLCRSLRDAGRFREAIEAAQSLIEMPRHPRMRKGSGRLGRRLLLETKAMAEDGDEVVAPTAPIAPVELPALAALGPPRWSPPAAPPFELPRGRGGEMALADFAGKPVLAVFFLGFGCVHCVEQLKEIQPRVDDFEAAGIEIVTIGTDTVDQVRASFQMAIENDEPRMPFPILCDPQGAVFKEYRCWDEWEDEALHGTFLIDGRGRIRWRDISIEPFMETDFLLAECVRLLALPRPDDK